MTPEEAREVELSRNPIERRRQVAKHLGEMGVEITGWGEPFVGLVGGRRKLVSVAQAEQSAKFAEEVLSFAAKHGVDERQATIGVVIDKLEERQEELRGEAE